MSGYHYDLIIRNSRIVTENEVFQGDVAVSKQKIVEIATKIPEEKKAAQEIEGNGLHVFPGLIDTHVHFNEPGRTEWEGFRTGSRSLAAGGVTSFFDMPLNSDPPLITTEAFQAKKEAAAHESIVDYALLGGLVPNNLENLKELKDAGVIGFKGFMSHSGINEFLYVDDPSLFEGMKKLAEISSIVGLHAENGMITNYLAQKAIAEGRLTVRDYVASRPVISEVEAVSKAATFAEITGCKVHIVHASSGEVVKRVTEAKERGVDISVETCPHYLALTVEDFEELGALAKCAPPIREREHVDSLWEALAKGEIDLIGSDHSPSPASLKEFAPGKHIFNLWGGLSTAQSTLNVMLEEGYWRRGIPLETIARVTAANPARRFGLYPRKGTIAVGSDADFAIVDLNASFTLQKEDLFYKHPQSPFVGKTFRGKVLYTFVRGQLVFAKGQVPPNVTPGQLITN